MLVMRNETDKSVQIMLDSEDLTYRLQPGDSVGIEMTAREGPIHIYFYEGGLHLLGGCNRDAL
jgi:hypothetical protein